MSSSLERFAVSFGNVATIYHAVRPEYLRQKTSGAYRPLIEMHVCWTRLTE